MPKQLEEYKSWVSTLDSRRKTLAELCQGDDFDELPKDRKMRFARLAIRLAAARGAMLSVVDALSEDCKCGDS